MRAELRLLLLTERYCFPIEKSIPEAMFAGTGFAEADLGEDWFFV